MVSAECPDCQAEVELGEVQIPTVQEFVEISCSECGELFNVSLLRLALQEKIKEKLKDQRRS